MIALSVLALWCIFTNGPLTRALALNLNLNLLNISHPSPPPQNYSQPSVSVDTDAHCTKDAQWLTPRYPNIASYDLMCQDALAKAIRDLKEYHLDTEFEFLDRGATAQTTRPDIRLPLKYVSTPPAAVSHRPSCTVAIAMINSLEPGPPLPDQPPGPLGSSDIMTIREILYTPGDLGKPLLQCLRGFSIYPLPRDPSFGWTQTGRAGNVGVFYMGTKSAIDDRIPRAVNPGSVETE